MCTVSMVGQHYSDKWREYTWLQPYIQPVSPQPTDPIYPTGKPLDTNIDWYKEYLKNQEINDLKKEFADLRKEVEDMKKLLERAAEYDRQNNEPACEVEEKVALLKRVAELVGVDLKDVLK